jgi:transcription antitermination factor NusG
MTEGSDELAFINVLIDKNLLKFNKEMLLDDRAFHSRQIVSPIKEYIQQLKPNDTVSIYRVGDKMSDKLFIPKDLNRNKIKDIFNVKTLPEFEILFLLNENLFESYCKVKSIYKPSTFFKIKNPKYNKQSIFVTEYFSNLDSDQIINLLRKYEKIKKHDKHLSLIDLIF